MLVDKKSGELFLYAPIGADFYGEGITAETVILALDSLGGKRAIVRINSPGGSVFDGIAIYNALKRYPGGVDTVVDSVAASIASVIALAGETRTTATGGLWMIHRAMAFAMGNAEDIQKVLSMCESGDRAIIDVYKGAMGKSEDEILALMSAETWFTASEAVAAGLSTASEGETKGQPKVAAWYRNAPKALYNTAEPTSVVKPNYPAMREAARLKNLVSF
jgi:ATP-dependent Clp protease protease subunit